MIMLHLHGQNTAALQLKVSGQAILKKLTRRDVFVKQADMKHFYLIPKKKLTPITINNNKQDLLIT
jgi:hypothetical protein